MEAATRTRLLAGLQSRTNSIAAGWYQAIVGTAHVACGTAEVRQRLLELTGQAILSMLAEPFDQAGARQVGVELARLHYLQAESIGRTVGFLSRALAEGLAGDDLCELELVLGSLLEQLVAGFYGEACQAVLGEQEQIRCALVDSLRASEQALWEAQARLEERVAERTAELWAEIEERKRVEEALRESEQRWRMVVDHAPDIVLTVDRTSRILYINDASLYSPLGEVIGVQAADFAVPEYQETVRAQIEEVFATGRVAMLEAPARGREGRPQWFAVRMGPLIRGGKVSSVVIIARDITERKAMLELKDNVIRDVSHELRTPLAKMQMSLELLLEMLREPKPDRQRAIVLCRRTFGNVVRLLGTVEAILDLSSLEAGLKPYCWGEVRIKELLQDAVEDLEPMATAQGVRLVADLAPDLMTVRGDANRLYRVVLNLIDNGLKFSNGKAVVIAAHNDGQTVRVAVSDSGQGILAENLERVFERFFQEKASVQGIGVGLTICRAIAEAHGGRMWAESEGRGKGAAIHMVLPVDGAERE